LRPARAKGCKGQKKNSFTKVTGDGRVVGNRLEGTDRPVNGNQEKKP